MKRFCKAIVPAAMVLGTAAGSAWGQWVNSSINTFKVADAAGDNGMITPTDRAVIPLADGGVFMVWNCWASGNPGYDTRVQRLNAAGVEQWAHNGIVVAPGVSSFTIVGGNDAVPASDGNFLIACDTASDNSYPDTRQANIQKIRATDGTKLWGGGTNIPVSFGSYGGVPVHICATNDGGCYVAYTSNVPAATGHDYITVMRYNNSGVAVWATPTYVYSTTDDYWAICMQPGASNSCILSILRPATQAALLVTKITSTGALATGWFTFNAATSTQDPIVLDSHGLTSHDFPTFISDGNGGAIFGWKSYANALFGAPSDAMLQHVFSNGALKWPVPVTMVDSTFVPLNLGRQSASLAYNAAEGSYFLAAEQGPAASGVSRTVVVQKIDSGGNRLYTPAGYEVVAEATNQQITPGQTHVVATSDGGCMVFGTNVRGFSTTKRIVWGARVNVDFTNFPLTTWYKVINSDTTTDKGRLMALKQATSNDAIVAFNWGGGLSDAIGIAKVSYADGSPGVDAVPPSFTTNLPPTTMACDNSTITLTVAATGTQNITYSWQRHYAAVPDAWWTLNEGDSSYQCVIAADGTTYSGTASPTLTIHNIHAMPASITCNSGTVNPDPSFNQYRCMVYNAASDDVTTSSATQVTVIASCCIADFNHNGSVTVQDIFDFLTAWFAHSISADVNSSGTVTVQDIFDFLAHWFAHC